ALALALAAGAVASAELLNRKGAKAQMGSGDTAKSADVIDVGAGLASGAFLAPKAMTPEAAAPQSSDALIDGLAGIRHGRDGQDTVIPVPEKLQMMLKAKKAMAPKPDKVKGKLVQIENTGVSPYASMGMIMSGCTGALVMKNYVLTSPWCVYNTQTKKFYDNLDFIPALNGNDAPVGTIKWKNVWIPKGFQDTGDLALAFALIELEGKPGDQMGWFGFGPVEGSENVKKLTVTGYPFVEVPKSTLWEATCTIDANEENAYFYRCPGKGATVVTMLGAPFFIKGPKEGDAGQLLGIHTGSQDDKQNS
ncbi:MAG: trypsin-like serine peptidase, partial [Aestuariivirga sp.]